METNRMKLLIGGPEHAGKTCLENSFDARYIDILEHGCIRIICRQTLMATGTGL